MGDSMLRGFFCATFIGNFCTKQITITSPFRECPLYTEIYSRLLSYCAVLILQKAKMQGEHAMPQSVRLIKECSLFIHRICERRIFDLVPIPIAAHLSALATWTYKVGTSTSLSFPNRYT